MEPYIKRTVISVLKGEDYRQHVLATINNRFLKEANKIIEEIFEHKRREGDWLNSMIGEISKRKGKESKFELLWISGLNNKTVRNIFGGSSKLELVVELGKKNIDAIRRIVQEADASNYNYDLIITIKKGEESITLDKTESVIFMNIISTMKLTIQGGAWSEVGKQTEKSLLYTIFSLLQIPALDYVLFPELINNREIDAIVFRKDDKKNPITIELKLLGIGNPEIGDEAQARKVNLFLVDRMTDMMIETANRINVKTIEFRSQSGKNALEEIYNFFKDSGVDCKPPPNVGWEQLEEKINDLLDKWDMEAEKLKMQRTIKRLGGI
jgi:hypothetical protein